jgi:hypothetical protein
MKIKNLLFILVLVLSNAAYSFAQTNTKKDAATLNKPAIAKSSPAYAEVLLRKTELLSELESILVEYTEEYPKVKELRFETDLLQKELDVLLAVNPSESSKLSAALGKLMVRKCELNTDLWTLQKEFNDQHPNVKRAKRKIEIFEAAIKDILQTK